MPRKKHRRSSHSFEKQGGINVPVKTLLWTAIVVVGLYLLHSQADLLQEKINLDPGMIMALTFLLTIGTAFLWLIWLLFLSGFRIVHRVLIAAVIAGLIGGSMYVFRPVLTGDVGIARWESIFTKRDYTKVKGMAIANFENTSMMDFPQFLGPGRDGVLSSRILDTWDTRMPKMLWKIPVGAGWSGCVAVNGDFVTMEQREEQECVVCYQVESGDIKWIHKSQRRHEDTMGMGGPGPRSTPTIHGGNVFVQGATGIVECLNGSDGTPRWSVDLTEVLNIEQVSRKNRRNLDYTMESNRLAWGRSASPLIYKNMVIVPGGGPTNGPFVTLLALDVETGEEIWRGGEEMIAYGSPSVATLAGRDQILLLAESQAMGFDPETGIVLWKHERPGGSSSDANCSQVTPVLPDKILLTKGYSTGGELVQLKPKGNEFDTESLWKNARILKTKFNSPVLRDAYAYALSDGYLECVEIESGQQMWKHPSRRSKRKQDRFGHGQFLLVGDKLLVHSESGVLFLVDATPEGYRELGRINTVDGVCWNTICLYENYAIVRSELEMACLKLPLVRLDESTSSTGNNAAESPGSEDQGPGESNDSPADDGSGQTSGSSTNDNSHP